jgi:hypothetical protein
LTTTIAILKKVTLSITSGSLGGESGKVSQTGSPVTFQFIYGLASDGLCPFEIALHDKGVGESLSFKVLNNEAQEFFGHLFSPLRQALGLQIMSQMIVLDVEVKAVVDADNREVVQSLAKVGNGCGGSCGCGC